MSYDTVQAKGEFQRWSASYDRSILQWLLFGPSHRAILGRLRGHLGSRPTQVLDIGCGTGVFMDRIRRRLPQARVWGIDLVAPMLAKGADRWRRHTGRATPIQGDSERLPFADDSFDAITCANSFHHYPRQHRAVTEMFRVLRPGGRLILVDGHRDWPWGWFIFDVCVAGVEGEVHHASARRMRGLTAEAGFETTTQRAHWGPAPFLLTESVKPDRAARGWVRAEARQAVA